MRDQWQRMALRPLIYGHIAANLLAFLMQQTEQNVQVFLDVRIPGIVIPDSRNSIASPLAPTTRISQCVLDRRGYGVCIQGIHQHAVFTVRYNITRPSIFRSDDGKSAGGGFNQGKPKWLGKRGINEYSATLSRKPVEPGDIGWLMVLGQRNFAPEIVTIDIKQ